MKIKPKKSKKFTESVKKLHRLLSILRILDNRARCTPKTLAEKFNICIRTIERDISDLNSAGFAITFEKELKTYSFVDQNFTLRGIDLTDNELMALLLGKQVAHSLGKPFEDAFASLLRKARTETGDKTKGKIKRVEAKQMFWVDIDPMEEFEKVEKQYNAINEAMDKKQELEITYKGMERQEETVRQIAPYCLMFHEGLWYTFAYCNLRKKPLVFALDCIKEFRLTGKPYIIPPDFNIDDYLKPGWKMRRYGAPVEVVLKFSEHYDRWIKRKKWHPTQVIEEQKDGSIIFKVKVEGTVELKWWIYHWIPHVEVLSPPELK